MNFQPFATCPKLRAQCVFLESLPPSPLSPMIALQAAVLKSELPVDQALVEIHKTQRLYYVCVLGLQDNENVVSALQDTAHYPLWDKFIALDATDGQKEALAKLMYEGDPDRRHPLVIAVGDYARDVSERIVERCVMEKVDFDIRFDDPVFQRKLLCNINAAQAVTFALKIVDIFEGTARTINLNSNHTGIPYADPVPQADVLTAYRVELQNQMRQYSSKKFYTSTRLPTPQAAEMDQMPYAEYIDLFFRMCAVDWTRVDAAHRVLIAKLDAGKILRITNNDGTDITMDLEGFTFANSLVAKNVPGSEVFSAPHRNSVNGTIVAKGRFLPRDGMEVVEDMTLVFKDGRVVDYSAAKGIEHLRAMIETDEGSHYVGEIGIGTNPVLQRHVVNSLMVEKIGGSFHVALGRAYEYTDYLGTPVALDNGNRSKIHWDITTMLVGKGGKMFLDGEEIMSEGKFLDPALAYLNGK